MPTTQPPFIPVFKPLLEQAEIAAAVGALQMGWLGMGGYVGDFERAMAGLIGGDRHVVAVSTGHAALHLALLLVGVGPGDEVITPSFNNIADFQAILATGASPVLCDIDDRTLCIDLAAAGRMIGPRTKAIIVMDYGSRLADHEAAAALAARHNLRLIHDAAHAFGSRHRGRVIGSFSDIAIFSFDPVKNITTIDGGAIVVKTAEEATVLREMRLIGMGQPSEVMYKNARAWTYDVKRLGFRYHMANLHARIGLSQMAKLDLITTTRRAACRRYTQGLAGLQQVRVPDTDFADVLPFIYSVRVPAEIRQALRDHLKARGVDTGIHWQPGHWFSLLKDCRRDALEVTERVGREIFTIPLHPCMDPADTERVIEAFTSYFKAPAPAPPVATPPVKRPSGRRLVIDDDTVSVVEADGAVRDLPIGSPEAFEALSDVWLRSGWDTKHVYSFTWLGRPIIQLPEDMVRLQEVIHTVKPDVIVETGIAHGGSLVFNAGLCKLMGRGRVIGVDIEIRPHNRQAVEAHALAPLITMIEGSSIAPATVDRVRALIKPGETVMVLLDSCHTKEHVAAELEAYGPLVTPGSYIVAMDGIMKQVTGAPRTSPDWTWNNPIAAAEEFTAAHADFVIEQPPFAFNEGTLQKPVTYWPSGYIRRVR